MAIVATHVAAVQELYVAYFGRPADPAGLDYWTNIVEAQGSTAAVSATFATSPEYIVTYYGKTNAQIVDQIYSNLFGRAADATGKAYWVDLLNKGTIKVDTIVAEVAAAAHLAGNTDAERLENKVAGATAFTAEIDTPAEVAGYNGTAALTQAKAFLTGITTDATLTAAINPATLEATVAAVVKAGTPFSLESGVAALRAANEAVEDFLEENDLDASTAADDLEDAVDEAAGDIATEGGVTGFDTATSANVRAALLEEAQADNAETLSDAQDALATARAAASASVRAVADDLAAATAANTEAQAAAAEAVLVQNAAEVAVEARAGNRAVTINVVDGEFVSATIVAGTDAVANPPATLVTVNSSGSIVLNSGITEANFPGVTALRDAIRANEDAKLVAQAATDALGDAQDGYDNLSLANRGLADDIETATGDVADAQDAIDELADLVTAYEEAVALEDDYAALTETVTAAVADFTAAGYLEPKAFNAATASATAGSDIFILGTSDEVTLSSFGRSGNDSIFLGSDFELNTGDLEDGDNAALEVFFVQNGSRAEIHIEKAVYGSESEDMAVITLVGVNAEDLQFSNGVITLGTTGA
ncbi:DUF4214 domain-containing protein [Massilia timonae]|uniref:DUF4214 domain-containing protein n=1 Tax=Massilia timonae TaxID=47229 RepID=UPI002355928F|nr:DUF4214 domain-containing protein [Massilia timonae]